MCIFRCMLLSLNRALNLADIEGRKVQRVRSDNERANIKYLENYKRKEKKEYISLIKRFNILCEINTCLITIRSLISILMLLVF